MRRWIFLCAVAIVNCGGNTPTTDAGGGDTGTTADTMQSDTPTNDTTSNDTGTMTDTGTNTDTGTGHDTGTTGDGGGGTCGATAVSCACGCGAVASCQQNCIQAAGMNCLNCVLSAETMCCPTQAQAFTTCQQQSTMPDGGSCTTTDCVLMHCMTEYNAFNTCVMNASANDATCQSYFATCFGSYPLMCM